jgi:hypothetical protein
MLRLKAVPGQDRFNATIDEILRWMDKRADRVLPPAAWERHSFELSEIGAQRTAAVALTEPTTYWSARLDDADKNISLRTWTMEASVGVEANGDVLFGARLICSSRGANDPFDRSIPGFIKKVIQSGPAELDGETLQRSLKVIQSETDVVEFVRLLERPERVADAIVFSLPDDSENLGDLAASAQAVHDSTWGSTHVFVITGPAGFVFDRPGRT